MHGRGETVLSLADRLRGAAEALLASLDGKSEATADGTGDETAAPEVKKCAERREVK